MVALLGRGAMGEVWHADDLILDTAVALKLIHSADEDARERILTEVRLARQITHPAVCRVFDLGESDGRVFYSMELVEGEDLATLLRRIGRVPSEKVADIALQLCGGLAAAHAQGVLHRDLKPANILIDADGRVRITDFGIAVTRGEPGVDAIAGTPGYMAPEQLVPGAALSERTDIYALGVVLYELIVGTLPFPEGARQHAEPTKPSAFVPDIDPVLERVVLRALAADPRRRLESAAGMAARLNLSPLAAHPYRTRSWWAGAAIAIGCAAVLGTLAALVLPRSATPLTASDTLVLADFMNTTGEPVFDGALKVALAVALEQSPFLRVFPDERVRETLRLIERSPNEPITRAVARDIARREQLKALVAGSIGTFGSHYVLTLEAVNAETGDVMAREQVEVEAKEQVLRSLGTATSRLREQLGESLASIKRFDVPLPRATTSSLDALHAYALALDGGRVNVQREAIPHLRRALELDPDFAMAQAALSGVYANTGEWTLAPQFSRRAFELRDRVSERERFFISWRYYVDAAQAWDQALEVAQSWTATYPREAFAFNSLGLASAAFGQHRQAVTAFREAIRLDPDFTPPYGNVVGSLTALGSFDEAAAGVSDATARRIEGAGLQRAAYVLAFLRNNQAGMSAALAAARPTSTGIWVSTWEARVAAFSGRVAAAHNLYQQGVEAALRDNLPELAAQWAVEDAEMHAVAGQCDDARREAAVGLSRGRDNFTLERAARTFGLCLSADDADALSTELTRRFPEATLTRRIQLPVAAAALALARGEAPRAIDALEPVRSYDHAPAAEFWPAYLRGDAHLRLRQGAAAVAQFESIVNNRGENPTSALYPLAHLGLARAAAAAGDVERSRGAYQAFFAFWKDADPTLPPLAAARREYARLQ
jgi:tetratricopeptide (TPR) repeat protein